GLICASMAIDIHIHDTYFIVAHFHYIMVGGGIMGYMGGLHYWWPKMTGRRYPELAGRLSAVFVFLGFNLTFFPQFLLGYMGMPRRYHAYPEEFQILNVMSSSGAAVLAMGYILPMIYFTWSLFKGKKAPANPYGAKGLEWEIPSPPPTENFTTTPIVTEEAYAYASEDEETHEVKHV
ncbi:MAG TPA: cbb3-type cytochrome c oxidase subunit I, partial [Bryobacteraceae bacterium]|nr:cbb3-type cytochrome c oxidase subunit I [Bryobacteraceae bacterium]